MLKKLASIIAFSISLTGLSATIASADEVTDWNLIMLDALRTSGTGGIAATRPAAIVQAAVYDAVNGIEQRYTPIHVTPDAAAGASVRAAAVQAAYAALVGLFPAQQANLAAKRAASLSGISSGAAAEHSQSIARGIEWGQTVASAIPAWRSTDGFSPAPAPYFGVNAVGQWRSTSTPPTPFASLQFAFMTPWVIDSPSQFPLPGPPALTSSQYAGDLNEVKLLGSVGSVSRTPDQTLSGLFWQSASSPHRFWDGLAVDLANSRDTTLSQNARLLAMVNIAVADAGIVVWNKKYNFNFWRPITAIQLADTDGNPGTTADPGWTPLLVTPSYPEYPSGLISVSSAAVAVLANFFGENTSFFVRTDSVNPPTAGVARFFPDFNSVLDELVNARIWEGIHFRTADVDARTLGTAIGNYVIANAFQSLNGKRNGQTGK